MFDWLIMIATFLTVVLGIGVLVYAVGFVWIRVFELLLVIFRIKKHFILWIYERNRPKRYSPELKDDEREKYRRLLARKKNTE